MDDSWLEEVSEVQGEITRFFKKKFSNFEKKFSYFEVYRPTLDKVYLP